MDRYLCEHYKGKYRVFPHLDLDTLDFPRDSNNEIDNSYADMFLKAKSGIEIKHGYGSELALYSPRTGVAYNVLKDYYKQVVGKESNSYYQAAQKLIESGYINNIDFMDGEVMFTFDAKYLDILHKIIKIRTAGANISPFSAKNLPKQKYVIPDTDMNQYKKAKEGIEPLTISRLNSIFGKENFGINYNIKLRKSHLKAIHFFHKNNLWQKYCEYLIEAHRNLK